MIDTSSERFRGPMSIPLLRAQADIGQRPGEGSINPEGLWTRIVKSWHHGAGQQWYDREDSDPYRFHKSEGVDVWTEGELRLLNTVELIEVTGPRQILSVGGYVYINDGGVVKFWTGVPSGPPTTVSGATSVLSIASDGTNVYATDSSNVYQFALGATSAGAAWNTLNADILGYVRGRLMAGNNNVLYNITSSSEPNALFTHSSTDLQWVGFADSGTNIYAAGSTTAESFIYRIGIKDDATALDAPVNAGQLPPGEVVQSIFGYLGFILVGSNKGIRLAQPNENGDLTFGALIETEATVWGFDGQSRFVWASVGTDSVNAHLVRLDLSTFTQPLVPAYAKDLDSGELGVPAGPVTISDRRVFTVSLSPDTHHVVVEDTSKLVTIGWVTTGKMNFGLPHPKVWRYVELHHHPLDSGSEAIAGVSVGASVDFEDPLYEDVGSFLDPTATIEAGDTRTLFDGESRVGVNADFYLELSPSSDEESPVVTMASVYAHPVAPRGKVWFVPLLLREEERTVGAASTNHHRDPADDLKFIDSIVFPPVGSTNEADWQIAGDTYEAAVVEEYEFLPESLTRDGRAWQGTCVVKIKWPDLPEVPDA